MNKLCLVGRLVRDPEIKYGNNNKAVARFTIAVQRRFKNAQGNYDSDFIPCVAFEKTAEFLEKYFKKSDWIAIIGHMQSGSFEGKNGTVYTLDCYVDEVSFVGNKNNQSAAANSTNQQNNNDGFSDIPEGLDMDLPFN